MSPYKTLRFGPGEIPDGLRRDHRVKDGVRATLTVVSGRLTFVDALGKRTPLGTADTMEIVAGASHHLEDCDEAAIELALFRT